jgi:peroxiredoxin
MTVASGSKKKIAFLVVLVVLIALFIAGLFITERPSGTTGTPTAAREIAGGERAPEFNLKTLGGGSVDLADFRGKVVMVHFWATWCPPCVEEIPTLDKLFHNLTGKDFALLAVSEDDDGAAVASFLQKNKLSLPVLMDAGSEVARQYGTYKLPETYIVDRQGVVQYKAIGPRDWTDPANIQILQKLIESK